MSNKSVVKGEENLPDFLRGHMNDNRGSEEVRAGDMVIPRIELVQSLSACRKKNDPSYIPGAEEGMLYNNITRELYGESVNVIPVYFRLEYLLWRDQKLGGGFGGSFPDVQSASDALRDMEKPDEWEVVDTNQHFVLLVKEDGELEEAVLSLARTKAKASRKWNSLIRLNGGPRFSRVYKLTGVPEQNSAGQDYFNIAVSNVGFVTKEQFKRAEAVYDLIKSGAVSVDRSDDGQFHEVEEEI